MCTEVNKSNPCCEYIKDDLKWGMNMFYYPKDNNGKDIIFETETKKGVFHCPVLKTNNLKVTPRIGENIKSNGSLYKVLNVTYDYDNSAVNVELQWIEPADNRCDECDFEHCWKNDEKFKKFKKNNFECLPKDFFSLPRKAQNMILEDVDTDRKKRCGEDEECTSEKLAKNIYGDTITASAANVIDEIYQDVTNEIKNDCTIYNELADKYRKTLEYADILRNILNEKSQELIETIKTKKANTKTTCNLMEETDKYFEEHKEEIQEYTKKNLELDKCHDGDETNFYVACGDCTNGGASTGIVGTPEQLENVVKNHRNIAWHTKEELVDTPASWKVGDIFTYRAPFFEEDNPKYKDWHGSTIVITDIIPAFHPETFDLVVIFLIKNLKTGEERKLSGTEFGCLKKIDETEEITKID